MGTESLPIGDIEPFMAMLPSAKSRAAGQARPDSWGMPAATIKKTVTVTSRATERVCQDIFVIEIEIER